MSKKLLTTLCLLGVTAATQSFAQSKLIHYWHFNNDTAYIGYTDSIAKPITGISADYSVIDTSKAKILYRTQSGTTAAYHSYVDKYTPIVADNDTFNARMGALQGKALRLRNPSDSMELRFYIPTKGYKNIALKFGCERSNNGMLQQIFDYSTDSGTTWRTTGLSAMNDSPTVAFKLTSINFGTDTLVNNTNKLVFRIKFAGNNSGTSGNNRIDNVTLEGDTITVANSHVAIANIMSEPEFTLAPNPATHSINLNFLNEGAKTIIISDLAGKTLFNQQVSGANKNIDLTDYEAGLYIIQIRNSETGLYTSRQFIKQ